MRLQEEQGEQKQEKWTLYKNSKREGHEDLRHPEWNIQESDSSAGWLVFGGIIVTVVQCLFNENNIKSEVKKRKLDFSC